MKEIKRCPVNHRRWEVHQILILKTVAGLATLSQRAISDRAMPFGEGLGTHMARTDISGPGSRRG